jgi:predicted CopG family antitoxin
MINHMSSKLRQIAVSQENYLVLKRLGSAGDSFNDVISGILKEQKLSQDCPKVVAHEDLAIDQTKNTPKC